MQIPSNAARPPMPAGRAKPGDDGCRAPAEGDRQAKNQDNTDNRT